MNKKIDLHPHFLRVYTLFLYLLLPFIVLRLCWKSWRLPSYRQRISERFTLNSNTLSPIDVWLHAVSLGEVIAATPLIDALLAKQWRVLVTTMTPTGSQQVLKRFGQRVAHQYIPYDLPWALRRFFKKYSPRIGIIMETELWPNIIDQAKQKETVMFLVNARLSDNAYKRYEKVDFMFKPILNQFTSIFAQSGEDAKRFLALGANPSRVQTLGNMKFDLPLQMANYSVAIDLKNKWGNDRTVVIAASTHEGEEKQLLSRLTQLKTGIANALLLLVPRHPERFQAIYQLSLELGFKTGLRSQPTTIHAELDVVVVDSIGELLQFYQISDYAFVGGSLVPIGGHNVLEPISVEVPVFSGPYIHNFKEICGTLISNGALKLVKNVDDLIHEMSAMHLDKFKKNQQVNNASAVLNTHRGTVERYMERITMEMSS